MRGATRPGYYPPPPPRMETSLPLSLAIVRSARRRCATPQVSVGKLLEQQGKAGKPDESDLKSDRMTGQKLTEGGDRVTCTPAGIFFLCVDNGQKPTEQRTLLSCSGLFP